MSDRPYRYEDSSLMNAVYNKSDGLTYIFNGYIYRGFDFAEAFEGNWY